MELPEAHAAKVRARTGRPVVFGIRPDDIYDRTLAPAVTEGATARLTVDVTEPMGSTVYVYLTAGKDALIADVDAETAAKDGEPLDVVFDMNKAHLFDPETEVALV